MNEEDKLEDFKSAMQNFIDDNYIIRGMGENAEIVPDCSEAGNKYYDKSIKELFEEVRVM